MEKVQIERLKPFANDKRGRTYELPGGVADGHLLAFRKAGSVSGNHWHEGRSKGKDPEILLLVSGEIELMARDLKTNEELKVAVEAPARITIHPNVLHTLTANTDCCFLEFNSLEEHKADVKYPG